MEIAIDSRVNTKHSITLSALVLFMIGVSFSVSSRSEAEILNPREACSSSTANVNLCLQASLQYRCMNYGNFSLLHPKRIRGCNGAVAKLVHLLDIEQVAITEDEKSPDDPVEKSGLLLKQVAFKRSLEVAFKKPETAELFNAALLDLQDSVRFRRTHNLWDSIYEKTGHDRNKSLKFIAEALQDVSFGIWHIIYLDRKYQKLPKNSVRRKNVDSAGEFIQLFRMNLENADPAPFSAYPFLDGLNSSLHPYLHHFYVPAFLASELKRLGHSEESAFFAAFLLNTGYEFIKLEAKRGTSRWPFHDPKKFDVKKSDLQLRKIYTGYIGALWGLGLEKKAKSFKEFSKDLANDPYGSMKSYFSAEF